MLRALGIVIAAALLLSAAPLRASAVEMPLESGLALDLGGEGLLGSIHYENLLLASGRHRLLGRVGVGYVPMWINGKATAGNFVVPIGAHYLYGGGAHHLELGVAVPVRVKATDLPVRGTDEVVSLSLVPSAGYRYENFADGRMFVGAAYSPRITQGVLGLTYAHFFRVTVGVRL